MTTIQAETGTAKQQSAVAQRAVIASGAEMSPNASNPIQVLLDLNQRTYIEETRGAAGVPFFRELLDQSLRFRRASGAIVTRDEFLIDLADPANTRERIEPIGAPDCHIFENTAVVSVLLHVVGSNDSKRFDGLFRNIRIFHRDNTLAPWRLTIWFNDKVLTKG